MKLVCEICGGKLTAKAKGLFECDSCGMQYDKSRIQEMVQEIKGTVKIEGEVKVAGTLKKEDLLQRVFMFLEDSDWGNANEYCEKVLDMEPENAEAYLGKLMVSLNVKTRSGLGELEELFDNDSNYIKALKFGDESLKNELEGYIGAINERIENHQKDIDEKAEAIARAAEAKQNELKLIPIDDKIKQFQKEKYALEEKKSKYPDLKAEYDSIIEQKKNNELKITELAEKKKTLGAFAGKEKKAIDRETEALQRDIRSFEGHIWCLKGQLQDTPDLIDEKISTIVSEINKLEEEKLSQYVTSSLSYDEASTLLMNKDILALFAQKYKNLINVFPAAKLYECDKGNIVEFGTYKNGDGINPITWKVLAKEGNKALLITEYGIDCKKYNEQLTDVTWETCTLRKWLNNDFYNTAFSNEEKGMIELANVTADRNPEYNTNPGKDTRDKVFLLSINEVNRYFASAAERKCKPTDYAVTNGAYKDKNNGNGRWCLRSPGGDADLAAGVYDDGSVDADGLGVYYNRYAVRPALWINPES